MSNVEIRQDFSEIDCCETLGESMYHKLDSEHCTNDIDHTKPVNKQFLEELLESNALKGKVMCVEGNIATGKTTLISALLYDLNLCQVNVKVLEEQIDQTLLEKFNSDPKKYGLELQDSMMRKRIQAMKTAQEYKKTDHFVIMDTGFIREKAFTLANYKQKNLTQSEFIEHEKVFLDLHKEIGMPVPDCIIILDCSPQRCKVNINIRNRVNERELSITYLDELRKAHKQVLTEFSSSNPKVSIINADVSDQYTTSSFVWKNLYQNFVTH